MEENNNKPVGSDSSDRLLSFNLTRICGFPVGPRGGLTFGKIWCIWKVARSSKKFAYGVYRSENRAGSSLAGPLILGIRTFERVGRIFAEKCWNHLTNRNSCRDASLRHAKKAEVNPQPLGSSIRNYHNSCKTQPCRLCPGQSCCKCHNLGILRCRCSHHPRPTSPQSHRTRAEGLPKYIRKEWGSWSSKGNPSH